MVLRICLTPFGVLGLLTLTSACSSAHLRTDPASTGPRIVFVDASVDAHVGRHTNPQAPAASSCDPAPAGSRIEPFAPCPRGYGLGPVEQELQDRWNASGAANSGLLSFAPHATFGWEFTCGFPAATFIGGSRRAYSCFGSVLLGFLARSDNLQFVIDNNLLDFPLYHGVYGSEPNGLSPPTTLRMLVEDFATEWASYAPELQSQFSALCETVDCRLAR